MNVNNIYCTSSTSCRGSNMYNIYGNIYSYGGQSGAYMTVDTINAGGNIYCSGLLSCSNSIINNIINGDIICGGLRCLDGSEIYNINNGNIMAFSPYAMEYSTLVNIGKNIIVIGYQAARSVEIYNVTKNIIGIGESSLVLTNIYNVSGCIIGYGPRALVNAMIYNAKCLYITGNNGAKGIDIIGVSQIVSTGYNSLSGAYIISNISNINNINNGEFKLSVNGTIDDSWEIECSSNDVCYIDCRSTNACSMLELYCFGTCFVICDDIDDIDETNGIDCPLGDGYTIVNEFGTNVTAAPGNTDDNDDNTDTACVQFVVSVSVLRRLVIILFLLCVYY